MNKTTSTNKTINNDERPTSLGLKPTFIFLYNFIGKVLSASFKTKKFDMENHETEALAQQSDDLMIEFFPTVESRWVKLFIFIGSVLGIYGKKYLEFEEEKAKKKPETPKPETPQNVVEINQLQSQNFPVNPKKQF